MLPVRTAVRAALPMGTGLKRRFSFLFPRSYHQRHARNADRILRSIEEEKGKVDTAVIRACDEYARDVLGWKGYAPWLRVYSAVAGKFKEGWTPDNYYGAVVCPALKGPFGGLADYKSLSNIIFRSPNIPDVGYFVNGRFYSRSLDPLPENSAATLFADTERVVFKSDSSQQGRDVLFLDRASFDPEAVRFSRSGVFQKYISQHSFFDEIVPGSVATLRLTTVVEDEGACSLRAAYLRVGRKADTHVQARSNIRIAVDRVTGVLESLAYLPSWRTTEKHPDTGFIFAGKRLPKYQACVDLVLDLHRKFPYARTIGWDVCVDSEGSVALMEWNGGHNDIKFSEAAQGPCFSDLGWETLWRRPKSP